MSYNFQNTVGFQFQIQKTRTSCILDKAPEHSYCTVIFQYAVHVHVLRMSLGIHVMSPVHNTVSQSQTHMLNTSYMYIRIPSHPTKHNKIR